MILITICCILSLVVIIDCILKDGELSIFHFFVTEIISIFIAFYLVVYLDIFGLMDVIYESVL